jgi:hypothetical protein
VWDKRRHVRPGSKREHKAFQRDPLAVLTSMPEPGAEGRQPGLLGGLADPLLDEEWVAAARYAAAVPLLCQLPACGAAGSCGQQAHAPAVPPVAERADVATSQDWS